MSITTATTRSANTTAVVDPRNPAATGDTFTTRLTYDALDRLVSERIPKDSRHGAFVTKQHEFDANSNQTASVDGTGARGGESFTAMDDGESARRRPRTSARPAPATEVSKLLYDADDNLVSETRPNGTRTDIDGDFSTAYTYDEVGQRTAEIRRSRGDGPASDLATSFAYDRRGNVIGVVDPKRNAQFGGDPAANATVDERRRLTYRYDRADNRIFAAEDPAGLNLRRELRYDANDNKVAEVGPRGFAGGADPAKFTETLDYDQRDLLVAQTDAKGRRETYQLRGDGKLVAREYQAEGHGNRDPRVTTKPVTTTYPLASSSRGRCPRRPTSMPAARARSSTSAIPSATRRGSPTPAVSRSPLRFWTPVMLPVRSGRAGRVFEGTGGR